MIINIANDTFYLRDGPFPFIWASSDRSIAATKSA